MHKFLHTLQSSWKAVNRNSPTRKAIWFTAAILVPGTGLQTHVVFTFAEQNEVCELTKSRHLKIGAVIIDENEYFSRFFSTEALQWQKKIKQIPPDLFDISARREEEHNMPMLVLKQ